MDHIAIMNPRWRLIERILSRKKRIESRWYAAKRAPWDKIKLGETVYFKNAGAQVTAKANVAKVLQFELTSMKVRQILEEYGGGIALSSIDESYTRYRDKRYCVLIFLKNPQRVTPFDIDKTGYGNMAAWICVDDVNRIRQ